MAPEAGMANSEARNASVAQIIRNTYFVIPSVLVIGNSSFNSSFGFRHSFVIGHWEFVLYNSLHEHSAHHERPRHRPVPRVGSNHGPVDPRRNHPRHRLAARAAGRPYAGRWR